MIEKRILDFFISSITQITDVLNNKIENNKKNIENINGTKLKYKTVSDTISTDMNITQASLEACNRMGTDLALCIMVGVDDLTSPILNTLPIEQIENNLTTINNSGVSVTMLKPHIGVDFSDNTNRRYYVPSDTDLFFNNWKSLILQYADICNKYNIPILCISCEMVALTVNEYAPKWKEIYYSLKVKYPDLLIIHSPKVWEFTDSSHEESLKYCDLLGSTLYLHYTNESFSGDVDLELIGNGFYNNEYNFLEKMHNMCSKYNKRFFITEIGCMPLEDGLVDVIPPSYSSRRVKNYKVTASLMRGFFKYLAKDKDIIGFSWWHMREPFKIYSDTETLETEKVMAEYVKGNII